MNSGANDDTEDSSQMRLSEFVHIVVASENKGYISVIKIQRLRYLLLL